MTLYDYCITLLSNIDRNHPVNIMKLYESIFDGDCWYEPVFSGRFEDIPFKYLRCILDNIFIEQSNRCINFAVYE